MSCAAITDEPDLHVPVDGNHVSYLVLGLKQKSSAGRWTNKLTVSEDPGSMGAAARTTSRSVRSQPNNRPELASNMWSELRYRDPCSASLNEDDNHTIKLVGNAQRKAVTLAKTCENTNELRECRAPKDWSILALQNSRTGKSHYLVICKCPAHYRLEGPLAHDQPTYAGLPGINVYGMLCVPPESYAPKPLKTPSSQSIYNKWKVRPAPVSSYRDTEYRSFQNETIAAAAAE